MKKYRLTPARTHLLNILNHARSPVSVDHLLRLLRVNKTTVYRQLDNLITEGLVSPVNFADRTTRYEISARHHHHLVCTKCHSVSDITFAENLETTALPAAAARNFHVRFHRFEFFGLCRKCYLAPASV